MTGEREFPIPNCPREARPDLPAGEVDDALGWASAEVRVGRQLRREWPTPFWNHLWFQLEWKWLRAVCQAKRDYEPTEQTTLSESVATDGGDVAEKTEQEGT